MALNDRSSIMTIRQQLQVAFDHYRPERHYMRGPGPKWRERHGGPNPSDGLAAHAETGSRPTGGWKTGVAGVEAALPHIEYPLWGGDWR
jgi:hypothetical protein